MSATSISVTIDAREAIATLAAARGVLEARRAIHDAAANAVALQVRAWFISRNGKAFLVARQDKGVKSGKRTLRILYLLLKSVTKGPDPSVLPEESAMSAAASAAVRRLVALAIKRRQPA